MLIHLFFKKWILVKIFKKYDILKTKIGWSCQKQHTISVTSSVKKKVYYY